MGQLSIAADQPNRHTGIIQQASQDLAGHMQQVGVDMKRLMLVENLAIALKEGSVPDEGLGQYIKRQKHLNQAGISLDNLVAIVSAS